MRGQTVLIMALAGVLALGALGGCSDNDETSPQFGTMRIRMTDAPAEIDQVNLVINEVAVRGGSPADTDSVSGWRLLRTNPVTIDLLTLRNGVFTTLAVSNLPAGTYSQIRLKLGAGSTIVVDGTTYPLTVPSGLQSGLKIVGPFNVPPGGTTDLAIDWDASRSIVLTGAGTYILKPVLRILPTTATGSITGHVLPDTVQTTVFAIQAPDTVTSTITASNGHFTLSVLSAGTYSVAFHPEGAYRDTTINGVNVTSNHTTDLGAVQLTHD